MGMASQLFWCHVRQRARSFTSAIQLLALTQSQAKIAHVRVAISIQQNITRLQIAVDHTFMVSYPNSLSHFQC